MITHSRQSYSGECHHFLIGAYAESRIRKIPDEELARERIVELIVHNSDPVLSL